MRRTLMVLLLVGGMLSVACRKKTYEAFYETKSQYELAVARDGDDAYGPDMDAIVASLKAVPADAVEAPLATALLATIATERKRIADAAAEEERIAAAAANAPSPVMPPNAFDRPAEPGEPTADAPVAVVDAGPAGPPPLNGSLTEEDFVKGYGSCVSPGAETTFNGKTATTHVVRNSKECATLFGLPSAGTFTFIFVDGKLASRQEMTRTTVILDGGPVRR